MDVFDRMILFGKVLAQQEKERILLASIYNDLRLYEENPVKRKKQVKFLFNVKGPIVSKFKEIKIDISTITRENWLEKICEVDWLLARIPGTKPLERGFALNLWLYHSGLCPLIHFAFDQWYELHSSQKERSEQSIQDLADLSTTYLYRLIAVKESFRTKNKIGSGAYSNVYRSEDGQTIYKVPRNLAALRFAGQQEYLASLYALNTGLRPYLPGLIHYDEVSACIQREFIEGITGFDLLGNDIFLREPYALNQIKEIYTIACDIYKRDGINFDIHPGNMMWSSHHKQWFLVDLGPMPQIGADYFPRGNFEAYFQKIWLDLYTLIVTVPIRSLDIHIDTTYALRIPRRVLELVAGVNPTHCATSN